MTEVSKNKNIKVFKGPVNNNFPSINLKICLNWMNDQNSDFRLLTEHIRQRKPRGSKPKDYAKFFHLKLLSTLQVKSQ